MTPPGALGSSEVVIDDWSQLGEAQRFDLVSRIVRAGERAEQMLEDSLATTAILGGGVEPRPTAVPVCAVTHDIVDQLSIDPPVVTVRGSGGLAAQVDRSHFVQVLTDLLTNAAKYGAPPIVADCASHGTDRVVIRASDHGEGISADFVPHLFDRYSRAEPARRSEQRVTRPGLYIVRALVGANGGTIDYEPPAGGPGGYVVTLPAAAGAPDDVRG